MYQYKKGENRKMKRSAFILITALLLFSCNGVYYNIPDRALPSGPAAPAIDYRFPEQDDSDISPGGIMMISFTKNLEGSTINDSTVSVKDMFGITLNVLVSLEQANIILVYPTDGLEAESLYSLTVSGDISDIDGLLLGEDITWSFRTGTAKDHTPPRVISSTPHRGDIAPLSLSTVAVAFSEALAPSSVTKENIYLEDKNGTVLPGIISYRADTFEAIINLSAPLEEKQYYTIRAGEIKDLEGNRMDDPWVGRFSTGVIQETETGIPCQLAEGYFGSTRNEEGRILRLSDGTSLLESTGLTWGDSIAHLMDHNTEGNLSEGTCLRLVVNGRNIAAPEGMNLNPVLKKLTVTETPPPGTCYIDPLLGRFVLPRPLLYSAMDSISEVYAPRIKPPGLTVETLCPECMTIESDGEKKYLKLESSAEATKSEKYVEQTSRLRYSLGETTPSEIIIRYSAYQSVESKCLEEGVTKMKAIFQVYDTALRSHNGLINSIKSSDDEARYLDDYPPLLNNWETFTWFRTLKNDIPVVHLTGNEWDIPPVACSENPEKKIAFRNIATSTFALIRPKITPCPITSTLLIDTLKVWHLDEAITREWLDAVKQNNPEALHPIYGEEFQYQPVEVRADYYFLP